MFYTDLDNMGDFSKTLPCRFFQLGQCTKGAQCPFVHQEAAHFTPTHCKFFLNGFCRNGDRCPFSHTRKDHTNENAVKEPPRRNGRKSIEQRPNRPVDGKKSKSTTNNDIKNHAISDPSTNPILRSGHASPSPIGQTIPGRKLSGSFATPERRFAGPSAVSPVAVSPPKFAGAALSSSPLVWGSTVWAAGTSPKNEFSSSLPANNGVWGSMSAQRSRALSAGWEEDARDGDSLPTFIAFEKTAVNVDKARSRAVSESLSEANTGSVEDLEELEELDFNEMLEALPTRPYLLDPSVLESSTPPTPTVPPHDPFTDGAGRSPNKPHLLARSPMSRSQERTGFNHDSDDEFSPVPTKYRTRTPSTNMAPRYFTRKAHERNEPRVLCSFHMEGNCRYGSQCRNIHGEYCSLCGQAALMPNDPEQNADHMFECAERQEEKAHSEASKAYQCAMCSDKVLDKGKRFGILTDCTHVFCLPCIKEYRANTQRSECPVCDTVSHYVVPSNVMIVDGDEKAALVNHYKEKMKQIPCKYFDGGAGSCKFGVHCHYAHKGDPVDKASRTLTGANGDAVQASSFNLGMFLTQRRVKPKHKKCAPTTRYDDLRI